MRSFSLGPAWTVFLFALLAGAIVGPCIEPIQRAMAGLCTVALLTRCARPRSLVVLGLALGVVGGLRQGLPLRDARTYHEWQGWARFSVIDRVDDRRHRVWMRAAGRPPVQAMTTGLEPSTGPKARGVMRIHTGLRRPRRNPDDRDRLRSSLARGAVLQGRVEETHVESAPDASSFRRQAREAARHWLAARTGGGSSLWCALLLGDRTELAPEVMERFQRLGLAHLLALSGLHVGLVAGLFVAALRRWRGRDSWWPVAVVLAWSALVGLTPSLFRAVGMVTWALAGRRLQRPAPAAQGLAVVGLLEWIGSPERLLGLGWWLSYAATGALLRAAPLLSRMPRVASLVALTVAAQLATLPWALSAFGFVSPGAPLFHLVAGPAFALLMAAGVGSVLLAALVPPLGPGCFALLQAASHVFGLLLLGLERIAPATWGHPGLGGWPWAVALACTGLWLVPWPGGSPRRRLGATVVLLAIAHVGLLARPDREWVTLDVGQGDAGVVRVGASDWLVVDAGPAFGTWNAGEAVVERYLARRNARRVTLLLTHGHRDHTGGALALFESGRVGTLVLAAADSGRTWARELGAAAVGRGIRVRWLQAGQELELGRDRIPCLWPPGVAPDMSTNDRSLVLALGPPGAQLLLTGDLEAEGESLLPRSLEAAGVKALKVAHHGGNTGTKEAFLRRLAADFAIVSCGRGNRYGHPHERTIARLEAANVTSLRTDEVGAVRVAWRGQRIRVTSVQRPP